MREKTHLLKSTVFSREKKSVLLIKQDAFFGLKRPS